MRIKNVHSIALILGAGCLFLAPATSASDPGSGDWPMWGGTPDRNMVSNMKGLPTSWDVKTKKNVKWVAQLGSQSLRQRVCPAAWSSSARTTKDCAIRRSPATRAC
jgi:hypothetical protein